MRDVLAHIRQYWLPFGLAVVALAAVLLVAVLGDRAGVQMEPNIAILLLSIGGGLLAASVAPGHPLRNGMVGGGVFLALAGAIVAVYRAAAGTVNVGEYGGSWEMYWLLSLFAMVCLAIMGAGLGYVGGYIIRLSASRAAHRVHPD